MKAIPSPAELYAHAPAAERRAQAFFEQVSWCASDPALRALAREMAAEEREHAALIGAMLDDFPRGSLDATLIFQRGPYVQEHPDPD